MNRFLAGITATCLALHAAYADEPPTNGLSPLQQARWNDFMESSKAAAACVTKQISALDDGISTAADVADGAVSRCQEAVTANVDAAQGIGASANIGDTLYRELRLFGVSTTLKRRRAISGK